jgi:hypothetical protein
MYHLVDAVLQYTTDRVVAAGAWLEQASCCGLHAAWPRLRSSAHLLPEAGSPPLLPRFRPNLQAIQGCSSLDEMHACRAKYLRAVTRYCLLRCAARAAAPPTLRACAALLVRLMHLGVFATRARGQGRIGGYEALHGRPRKGCVHLCPSPRWPPPPPPPLSQP